MNITDPIFHKRQFNLIEQEEKAEGSAEKKIKTIVQASLLSLPNDVLRLIINKYFN